MDGSPIVLCMTQKKNLESDFVATKGGDLTPTAEAIREIMSLRSSAVLFVKKANELIDNRLRRMCVESDLEEVVFVSTFDQSVVVVLTNTDDELEIRFVPNETGISPGIVGYRFRGQ